MKQTLEGVELALVELGGVFDCELTLMGSVMDSLDEIFARTFSDLMLRPGALSLHPHTHWLLSSEMVEKMNYATIPPSPKTAGVAVSHIINRTHGGEPVPMFTDPRLLWTEVDIVWRYR